MGLQLLLCSNSGNFSFLPQIFREQSESIDSVCLFWFSKARGEEIIRQVRESRSFGRFCLYRVVWLVLEKIKWKHPSDWIQISSTDSKGTRCSWAQRLPFTHSSKGRSVLFLPALPEEYLNYYHSHLPVLDLQRWWALGRKYKGGGNPGDLC